jgi:hypothetical protein
MAAEEVVMEAVGMEVAVSVGEVAVQSSFNLRTINIRTASEAYAKLGANLSAAS